MPGPRLNLGTYFLNSVEVVISAVIILLVISAPASYILSRVKFRGSKLITTVFIAGIGIPVPLLFIPLFIILARIKLINTLPGLALVYLAVSLPFTVYMLTGFFGSLPQELEDAAIIDGCSDVEVFSKVMLPLASPGLITAAIFNFIFLWNEYQLALVFLSNPNVKTLSLSLYVLAEFFAVQWRLGRVDGRDRYRNVCHDDSLRIPFRKDDCRHHHGRSKGVMRMIDRYLHLSSKIYLDRNCGIVMEWAISDFGSSCTFSFSIASS